MKQNLYTKTEESIFTLWSLFILIEQAFESLTGDENIMLSKFDDDYSFHDLVTDTIHEALVYQIVLKTCAFMDEWNNIFGVKTEPSDNERILAIKKIVKPAYQNINSWKELREFRNQVVAHNHRDKSGANVYLEPRMYDSPESNREIFLICYSLFKMVTTVRIFFENEYYRIFQILKTKKKLKGKKFITKKEMLKRKQDLDDKIDPVLESIIIRKSVLDAMANNNNVTITHIK